MRESIEENTLLTVNEVASRLHITPRTVHGLVRERKLSCVQVTPRLRLFHPEHGEAFIKSRTVSVPESAISIDTRTPAPVHSPAKFFKREEEVRKSEGLDRAQLRREVASWR